MIGSHPYLEILVNLQVGILHFHWQMSSPFVRRRPNLLKAFVSIPKLTVTEQKPT